MSREGDFMVLVDGVCRSYGVRCPEGFVERLAMLFMSVQANAEARGMISRAYYRDEAEEDEPISAE